MALLWRVASIFEQLSQKMHVCLFQLKQLLAGCSKEGNRKNPITDSKQIKIKIKKKNISCFLFLLVFVIYVFFPSICQCNVVQFTRRCRWFSIKIRFLIRYLEKVWNVSLFTGTIYKISNGMFYIYFLCQWIFINSWISISRPMLMYDKCERKYGLWHPNDMGNAMWNETAKSCHFFRIDATAVLSL